MSPADITTFFTSLRDANPHPRSELEFASVFELLAAVSLSAQATDVSVNLATRKLFIAAPTPRKMAALGAEGIEPLIRTIGLYRNKAKNLAEASRLIVEQHGGRVPGNREALEALPGVGRKTANVILNVAFGQPTMAVDTHVFRVSNRTGLAPGKTPMDVERSLMQRIPDAFMFHAHHWLILHGRYVCQAKKPLCPQCGVAAQCSFTPKATR